MRKCNLCNKELKSTDYMYCDCCLDLRSAIDKWNRRQGDLYIQLDKSDLLGSENISWQK